MSTPVIITVTITGAVPTNTDNPAVPLTPLEQIEATRAAYKQGASLATGSLNFVTQIYENHPELIAAMAQTMLDAGIKPEIEVLDLAMLYTARSFVDRGLITPPPHVQFALGIPNALPARQRLLEIAVPELEDLLPEATRTAAGTGCHQPMVEGRAPERGGHVRTRLEDNLKYDRTRLADSSGELVAQAAALCAYYGRYPATPSEARTILGLSATA